MSGRVITVVNILGWLNDQLLKMVWLEQLFAWLYGDVMGLDHASGWYHFLVFFSYDVVKIFILLSSLIYLSSYIQAHFTPEKTRSILMRFKGFTANLIGALLGTITPFCSCSSIPIFIGFTRAGLPIGVTFSFLISSPLVDLASVILLASVFNWQVALIYVVVGLVIAIMGGSLISVLHMEDQVADFIRLSSQVNGTEEVVAPLTRQERHRYAREQVGEILHRVWLYVVIGVAIGATIHGFIPQAWVESVLGDQNPFSVVIATLIGVPMYADLFGTLPIAEALVAKGVQLGTVLAFMMAVTALSLPSIVMIKKVIKTKLLLTFVGIVVTGILIMGYLFNAVSFYLI